MHLGATDYGPYLANDMTSGFLSSVQEPSPLHTTMILEKCTQRLLDEYNHMLTQATEPLSTFLDYITYGHMIDNVVLIVKRTLLERDVHELLEKCHPLGLFDRTTHALAYPHYAALGRDKIGAESINLIARDKPTDVYSGIAARSGTDTIMKM